jgi:hypothetical protein
MAVEMFLGPDHIANRKLMGQYPYETLRGPQAVEKQSHLISRRGASQQPV